MAKPSDTARRALALVPLQLVILAIGVGELRCDAAVPRIIGWMLVVAVMLTLAGYALAIRREARQGD